MRHITISLTDADYQSLADTAQKVGTTPTTMARAFVLAEMTGINPATLSKMERRSTAFSVAILERILGLAARQNGITGDEARIAAQSAAAQIAQEIEVNLETEHD
ncbi:helix-turn-helix transcriptional regulator [Acidithiobacillus sp. 'AMD consortium']|uniref:helix-turn-helix domain-containing protein n=1 Tax=Acidithiobacillus sp. 'AMD consortium' TaxID=2614801 RepID=UPI00124EAD15|nr:helix-turn-helix transcriptional regulator [Acidithiobacillus sp. 'AMD consortium']QFG77813.1 helix-turn-helix transcriptional regulator [Acidithiobacillus sp. 'AMD consortium']